RRRSSTSAIWWNSAIPTTSSPIRAIRAPKAISAAASAEAGRQEGKPMSANDPHILSAFDRDLEAVQALVLKMGGMVEAAIIESAQALEHRDSDLADAVRDRDRAIDALEMQINTEAARIIAIR